jgi:hypothetical protein
MDRRTFTKTAITAIATAPVAYALEQAVPSTNAQKTAPKPSALGLDMVKEFVIAAHGNMEKTESMLKSEPGLVNATWDWGGGDFEQAIGGAGHMGRKDIALFLIANGARMDIFVAAMLGDLELVQSFLKAHPDHKDAKGPHGISLIRHAEMGLQNGVKEAESVVRFLKSLA